MRRGSTNWRLILIVVTHLLWSVKERRAFFPVFLFLQSPIEVPSDWSSMWLWRPELVKVMGLLCRESKGGGYCMSTLRVVWGLRNWEALSLRELEKKYNLTDSPQDSGFSGNGTRTQLTRFPAFINSTPKKMIPSYAKSLKVSDWRPLSKSFIFIIALALRNFSAFYPVKSNQLPFHFIYCVEWLKVGVDKPKPTQPIKFNVNRNFY